MSSKRTNNNQFNYRNQKIHKRNESQTENNRLINDTIDNWTCWELNSDNNTYNSVLVQNLYNQQLQIQNNTNTTNINFIERCKGFILKSQTNLITDSVILFGRLAVKTGSKMNIGNKKKVQIIKKKKMQKKKPIE